MTTNELQELLNNYPSIQYDRDYKVGSPVYYNGQRFGDITEALSKYPDLPTTGWQAAPQPGLVTQPGGNISSASTGYVNQGLMGNTFANPFTGSQYYPLMYNTEQGAPKDEWIPSWDSGWNNSGTFSGLLDTALPFLASTLTGGISDMGNALGVGQGGPSGDVFSVTDRAIDPGGVIDKGTRALGKEMPELGKIAQIVGPLVGSIWGPGGAAAGAGIASKLNNQPYRTGFQNAGMAAIGTYVGQGIMGGGNATPDSSYTAPSLAEVNNLPEFTVNPELDLGYTPAYSGMEGTTFGSPAPIPSYGTFGDYMGLEPFEVNPNLEPGAATPEEEGLLKQYKDKYGDKAYNIAKKVLQKYGLPKLMGMLAGAGKQQQSQFPPLNMPQMRNYSQIPLTKTQTPKPFQGVGMLADTTPTKADVTLPQVKDPFYAEYTTDAEKKQALKKKLEDVLAYSPNQYLQNYMYNNLA